MVTELKLVTSEDVQRIAVNELGLDASQVDLETQEAIAALIRRTASFLAPCSGTALRREVERLLKGLNSTPELTDSLSDAIEDLIGYGDLIELSIGPGEPTLLYLGPPRFMVMPSGLVFLIGVEPDGGSVLPASIGTRIDYRGHVRQLSPMLGEDLPRTLVELGLTALDLRLWTKAPQSRSAEMVIDAYNRRLEQSGRSGNLPGLQLIAPDKPVTFYKGRWEPALRRSGHFVARRPVGYGADEWCYVSLDNGEPRHMISLGSAEVRGHDEAWLLQAAIDARRGSPQIVRVRKAGHGAYQLLDFFSPIPGWAQRRFDILGERVNRSTGTLFTYRLSASEATPELDFLQKNLWIKPTHLEGSL